jgi:hypothetical protein
LLLEFVIVARTHTMPRGGRFVTGAMNSIAEGDVAEDIHFATRPKTILKIGGSKWPAARIMR